jgi:hypothetical protein
MFDELDADHDGFITKKDMETLTKEKIPQVYFDEFVSIYFYF